MEIRLRVFAIRVASLLALAISAALLAGYLRPTSLVCTFADTCGETLSSSYSKVLSIPLPVFGLVVFAAIFAFSLQNGSRWRQLVRFTAFAACVAGFTLIILQVFVLHSVCPFCMAVDSCALFIAYWAFGWRVDAPVAPIGIVRHLWCAAAVVALMFGTAWGTADSWLARGNTEAPPEIRQHWVEGKVNIVEITDFQCDYCRRMHEILMHAVDEEKDRIHLVRIMAPMPNHEQARDAALAYLCAKAQGKGEQMAELLFHADDLSPQACERLAPTLGISTAEYRSCVASAQLNQQIDNELAWAQRACPEGLPVVWIQNRRLRLSGSQPSRPIEEALQVALGVLQRSPL